MSKKTILWLSLISVILGVVGGGIFAGTAIAVGLQNCTSEQLQNGSCTVTNTSAGIAGLGLGALAGLLILIAAGIFGLIAWIGALISSASLQSWGWFVAVLLLGGLGALIYGIAGPANAAMGVGYPIVPGGYPPAGYPPPGYPPPGYPPQSYPASGYSSQPYPPTSYPSEPYPPTAYPPPPPPYPPTSYPQG